MKIHSHTKSILLILSSLLLLSNHYTAKAEQLQLKKRLPLACRKIPNLNEHLCFIETQNLYGPFDDVVFYRMDSSGNVALLGSQTADGATFGGVDFSTGGTFMWLGWAEEGHPHFEFYRTLEFMTNGLNSRVLKILGDYYFDGFEKFTDVGEVTYLLSVDAYEDCNKVGEGVSVKIDPITSKKRCLKQLSLTAQ